MKCKYSPVQCMFVFGSVLECCSFEMAESYCAENSEKAQENHCEYMRIIDDLSTDLNTLSCQVNMVQSEFLDDELAVRFESSLKDLETQNDLLQVAVDSLNEQKDALERTFQTENEELKNMVCSLEQQISFLKNQIEEILRKPCERCEDNARFENQQPNARQLAQFTSLDEKVGALESDLRRKCRAVEVLKAENESLQKELSEIKRNQAKTKLRQIREPTPDKKFNPQELLSKLKVTEEKNHEQCKSIEKLSKQLFCVQKEVEELHTHAEAYKKERNLLQNELTALKESQASQIGTQKSLKEQLQRTTNELFLAKENLSGCYQKIQQLENMHSDGTKRFREVVGKYNNLVEDFNEKEQEYQKLVQINEEKDKILAAFDAWKIQQIQIDKEMQRKTQLFETHIKTMIEDKQKLLDLLNETENVNHFLTQTIENSGIQLSGNQSNIASGSLRGYKTSTANNNLVDPVSRVIENIRHTARKLSHQRSVLEDEADNLTK